MNTRNLKSARSYKIKSHETLIERLDIHPKDIKTANG